MNGRLDTTGLSARNRRILALGIHGAEGDEPLGLDALLDRVANIADLSDDDLLGLEGDLLAAVDLLAESARASADDEALANLTRAAEAIATVRTTAAERITHAEEVSASVDSILAGVHGEADADAAGDDAEAGSADGDTDADADGQAAAQADETPAGDEAPAADADAEPLAAAAAVPVVSRVAARRPDIARPRARHAAPEHVLRASANVPGMVAGEVLDTNDKIAQVFERTLRASAGYRGPRVDIPVASLGVWDAAEVYGEQRTLRYNARDNMTKIDGVTSRASLAASGGICAPVPIQYDLPMMGTDARPVRDALARFGADRGGVRLLPPPMLNDLAGAIGIWTEANDVAPGSPATKPCIRLDCPEEYETLVDAITNCLEIGNFRARYFPEQVQAWVEKAAQMHARVAEQKMLDKIGTDSTQVAVSQVLGTTRDVLTALDRAGAAIRNRHRLDPDYPLRFLGPSWLLDNMISDLTREHPGSTAERLATNDAEINAFLSNRQINASWFLDGETNTDQMFGPQGDGLLLGWPDKVVCYLFIEGQWLYLDGGALDFGVVRDSTLNSTNDFQMFSETFENVVFHGYESYRMELDICADGSTAQAVDTSGICASGS